MAREPSRALPGKRPIQARLDCQEELIVVTGDQHRPRRI